MIPIHTLLQDVAAVATASAVIVAAWQLRQAKMQAQLQFEDSLNQQYREILKELPLAGMLGQPLPEGELRAQLRVFYRYFDLSNEQAFLHAQGRIRRRTWANWIEGIRQNMARAAFRQAWHALLPDLDGSFDELKAILRGVSPASERASKQGEPLIATKAAVDGHENELGAARAGS